MKNIASLFDHHIHSEFSEDSNQNIEELVKQAIKNGKSSFVATDHSDLYSKNNFFCADIKSYDEKICELKKKYPEIKILRGSEIGYENRTKNLTQEFIDEHKFDIVILSIHSVLENGIAETFMGNGVWKSSENFVLDYYTATYDAVKNIKDFDILGHLDYALRYEPKYIDEIPQYEDLFVAIFEEIIKKDVALEINTAGLRAGLSFCHPQPYLLGLYKKCGGKLLTLGSDAHNIRDVNANFYDGITHAKNSGFKNIHTLENGVIEEISIDEILK